MALEGAESFFDFNEILFVRRKLSPARGGRGYKTLFREKSRFPHSLEIEKSLL